MADNAPHDVFISYKHKDKEFVSALAKQLRGCGLEVWVDEFKLVAGDILLNAIQEGILSSAKWVAIINEDYLEGGWSSGEYEVLQSLAVKKENKQRFLPVIYRANMVELFKKHIWLEARLAIVANELELDANVNKVAQDILRTFEPRRRGAVMAILDLFKSAEALAFRARMEQLVSYRGIDDLADYYDRNLDQQRALPKEARDARFQEIEEVRSYFANTLLSRLWDMASQGLVTIDELRDCHGVDWYKYFGIYLFRLQLALERHKARKKEKFWRGYSLFYIGTYLKQDRRYSAGGFGLDAIDYYNDNDWVDLNTNLPVSQEKENINARFGFTLLPRAADDLLM